MKQTKNTQKPYRTQEEALRRLSESLKGLALSLTDMAAGMTPILYAWHGQPFGPSERAMHIWKTYRQFTTTN